MRCLLAGKRLDAPREEELSAGQSPMDRTCIEEARKETQGTVVLVAEFEAGLGLGLGSLLPFQCDIVRSPVPARVILVAPAAPFAEWQVRPVEGPGGAEGGWPVHSCLLPSPMLREGTTLSAKLTRAGTTRAGDT